MSDESDNALERSQRLSPPILSDVAEQSMFDLVPLTCPWRQVANVNLEPRLIGQLLQLEFPDRRSVTVAATRVGGDKEFTRIRIGSLTHHPPPLPNRLYSKFGCVMITPNADPCFVSSHVVDPVGNSLALRIVWKVV